MSSVENYLFLRLKAERLKEEISAIKVDAKIFLAALDAAPGYSATQIPHTWRSREELRDLLIQADDVFVQQEAIWRSLPINMQRQIDKPILTLA